jgi:hypothetical protein
VTASDAGPAAPADDPAVTPRPMLVRSGNPARLTAFVWRRILDTAGELGWAVAASPWSAPGRPRDAGAAAGQIGLPEQPTARQVAAALTAASPSSLVLSADPDPLSAVQADAVELFTGAGGTGLCAPAAMRILLDKLTTRRLCARIGVPTAPGTEGEAGDPLFRAAAASLLSTYGRIMLKGRWGWAGNGNLVVERPEELAEAWARAGTNRGPAIAEAFIHGQEVSVELVAGRDATTVVGWAVKGRTGSSPHPLGRLRFAPSCPPPPHLAAAAAELAHAAGYLGIVEIDYVVDTASGSFWLLEANPRTGAVTALLAAGTDGSSSLELAMRGEAARLAGRPAPEPPARLPAAEFTTAPHLAPGNSRPHARRVHPAIEGFRPHIYLHGDEGTLLGELELAEAESRRGGAPRLTGGVGSLVPDLDTLMQDAARMAAWSPIAVRAGA